MFKRLTLVAAMLSASPLCAAPMEILPSGHPVAIVTLGESPPLRFIIDTAASSTSVLPKLRAAMPDVGDAGDGQTISGAAGQTRIDTIRLAWCSSKNTSAVPPLRRDACRSASRRSPSSPL